MADVKSMHNGHMAPARSEPRSAQLGRARTTRIYLSPPHLGGRESALLAAALQSNWIAPLGPFVDEFEAVVREYVGTPAAVALASGTAALHLALLVHRVGPGDDVIVPTLTFVATANAVAYVGAHPVFVDVDPTSWQMSPTLLARELNARALAGRLPAAVISVDLYGQCADYDALASICSGYGIPLIEDAAEAFGAKYKGRSAGGLAGTGVLSFNGNKIITTSGGGMLLTHDLEQAIRIRHLASQARDPAPHYQHSEIGYNYRLSNLLAAVGVAQMDTLDSRVRRRQDHNRYYRERLDGLPGVAFMPAAEYGESTWWLTCMTLDPAVAGVTRDDVRLALVAQGIEARPVWKPLHLQPVFKRADRVGGAVAEGLFDNGLCLPSGSSLTDTERREVADVVVDTLTSGNIPVSPGTATRTATARDSLRS